jgi:hypothetical protein
MIVTLFIGSRRMRCARFSLVAALCAGLAAAVMAAPAVAQDASAPAAPAKPKRKPAPKVLQVQVLNQRDATLVELTVLGRTKNAQSHVIASGIGPGGKMVGKLPANLGCVFSVSGSFDDESTVEVPAVNLCKDPRITLVE